MFATDFLMLYMLQSKLHCLQGKIFILVVWRTIGGKKSLFKKKVLLMFSRLLLLFNVEDSWYKNFALKYPRVSKEQSESLQDHQ